MEKTFIRFIIVGVINTIVGLSIMFILFHIFQISYWLATFIGNLVGAFVSYLLNRSFTFQNKQSMKKTIFPFFLVLFICYLISYTVGKEFAYIIFYNENLPFVTVDDLAILIGSCFYTILNYFGQKQFVFRQSSSLEG